MTPPPLEGAATAFTCPTCAAAPARPCVFLVGPKAGRPRGRYGLHAPRLNLGDEAATLLAPWVAQVTALTAHDALLSNQADALRNEITDLTRATEAATNRADKAEADLTAYKTSRPDVPPPTDPDALPGYRLLLKDTFDAPLDAGVWDVKDRYHMGGRDDVSMAANVSVVSGVLRNTMRKQSATGSDGATTTITTGNVWLRQKLPNQFRAQFKVKVPWQTGCWPGSVWFTGSKSGAELDVYEVFPAQKPYAKVTLHSRPYTTAHIQAGVTKTAPTLDGFVKVDVEKLTRLVKVWWDDALVATFDPISKGWDADYWEDPAQVWTLWYNLQSGGYGGKVDASTDWTKTVMDLADVRIWVPA